MRLDPATCRLLFSSKPVARLATVGRDRPHLVPIVFALDGDEIVFAVDHKPKSTRRLQRLANLTTDPHATVLADHYADDWSQLWWVRADAIASISDDRRELARCTELLSARYPQYVAAPPEGPVVRLGVVLWSGWSAGPVSTDRG